jgi:predicted nucleic acid-binding protein
MTLFYVDASAWVKRYFQEAGSEWINQQFEQGILMGASMLGLIEVTATCARKRTAGAIDAGRFQQIEIDLLEDWKGLFQVDLTPDIVERSLDVARTHALRGADCAQLASAIFFKEQLAFEAGEFALVTSDQELKSAALKAGGLAVVDPQEQA